MTQAPRYPVALDIAGRRCVVIGGGLVAARKVASLRACGADVRVISPALCPALEADATQGNLVVERRAYRPGDVDGAFLAIAATNVRSVNAAVAAEARAVGALATICDDAAASDVVGLATVRRGRVTVGIGTDGDSPALARLVREEIEALLTPEYADLLELVSAQRRDARAAGRGATPAHWRAAVTPEVLALLRAGQRGAAAEYVRRALNGAPAPVEHLAGD